MRYPRVMRKKIPISNANFHQFHLLHTQTIGFWKLVEHTVNSMCSLHFDLSVFVFVSRSFPHENE